MSKIKKLLLTLLVVAFATADAGLLDCLCNFKKTYLYNSFRAFKSYLETRKIEKIRQELKDLADACVAEEHEWVRKAQDKNSLITAVKNNSFETVARLLYFGANPNVQEVGGKTALAQAVFKNNIEIAEHLLQRGARVNEHDDEWNCAALHRSKTPNMTRLLLTWGADIDAQDNEGCTPLNCAAQCNAAERSNLNASIEILIEHGADILKADKRGCSPYHASFYRDYSYCTGVKDTLLYHAWRQGKFHTALNMLDHDGKTPMCHLHPKRSDKKKLLEDAANNKPKALSKLIHTLCEQYYNTMIKTETKKNILERLHARELTGKKIK